MEGNFDYLYNNLMEQLKPPEWDIYRQLIETDYDLDKIRDYHWVDIMNDARYSDILLLLNDFENNYSNILNIVKEILIDKIKTDYRFEYIDNDNIKIKSWYINFLSCCKKCGNIWDGFGNCGNC
jgi:hypothetical protein